MNLRQKRKHYKYSCRYFVAWYSVHEDFFLPCPKKYKKTLKQKLKVNRTYDYEECCRKYWLYEEFHGNIPKFMEER